MRSDRKKIMILGAGVYQLAGIRAAFDLGLHTITVDYLPENVGHRVSHQFVHASTTDPERVLASARELSIDGIVTFASDVAVPTAAYVADQLGLPGCGVAVAATMCNKARFREFQRAHGLDAPLFAAGRSAEELEPAVARLRPPMVVKPVDTSGSRGISRVDRVDRAAWEPAFARALAFSRSGEVCVEELVEGVDVTCEGLMRDGEVVFAAFTRKHRRDFLVLGHELPGRLPELDQRRAIEIIATTCGLLGYRDGPLDVDLVIGCDRVVIVEMAPRTGGNGIPPLIAHATGFDLDAASVLAALGERVLVTPPLLTRPSGSMVIGAPGAGVLSEVASRAELCARAPHLVDVVMTCSRGDVVQAFEHGGTSLGYCVFDLAEGESWEASARRVERGLGMTISRAA